MPERDGHLWVADMDTPKIDFQVLKDVSLRDLITMTAAEAYNMAEGPLWRSRLLMCPPDEPCKMPHVKDAFPHQYHIAFDVHHAITDGVSFVAIQQTFFTILDSLLGGAQIDDTQFGELRDMREARAAEAKIRETLEKDPQRLKVLLEERYKVKTRVPLITEAFGVPQEPSPATYTLESKILDDKLLQVFNAKCKVHKVTFNSGIVGVTNVALIKLVREAGMVRDSYTISSRHPVDTRRYMSDVKSMVWSYHSVPMTVTMKTPWNVRKYIWKYIVDFDAKFRGHMNKMGPLEERVLDAMLQLETLESKHKAIYDLYLLSVYSPRVKGYGNGKHVQLTDFQNYFPVTQTGFRIAVGVAQFRDKVRYQLGFSSGFITRENAAKFSDNVLSVFNDVARSEY